ncbi:MAG TPA: cyclic nucleotide-binding domain-containing protein [Macromonas sp.]|nr:cyclic nucleotide-binding domain-containing protein [Macromonas sp.]
MMVPLSNQPRPMVDAATRLLITPSALVQLSLEDARQIAGYMQYGVIAAGETFMHEGDEQGNDHMLLVLDGEVQVKGHDPGRQGNGIVVRVVGEGSLIGELGLLDGVARSADCIALTELQVGVLYRSDLMRLLEADPRLGNRLLLAISARTAARLREITTKFRLFVQMNKAMSAELAADPYGVQERHAVAGRPATAPPPAAPEPDFTVSRYINWPELP